MFICYCAVFNKIHIHMKREANQSYRYAKSKMGKGGQTDIRIAQIERKVGHELAASRTFCWSHATDIIAISFAILSNHLFNQSVILSK